MKKRGDAAATLISGAFLLAGCQISVDEKDVFQPGMAEGTKFTVETGDGPIFVLNKARPGLFEDIGVSFEVKTIPSGAGALNVQIARTSGSGKPLIVYCGGNAWDIPNNGDLTAWSLTPFGDVALWDYPGYGLSKGEPTIANFKIASEAILATLENLKRTPEQEVVFWGHSLGGFVCAEMSGKAADAEALILMTTAPSAEAAVHYLVPWYLRPFAKVRLAPTIAQYDIARALDGFDAPILVIGAGKDKTLPVVLSRKLRDALSAAGHRVTYAEPPKRDHFDIVRDKDLAPILHSFLNEASKESE